MKLDHATRNGLSLGGVYSDAYSQRTQSSGACNGFNLLPTDTRTSGTCAENGYSEIADADTCAEFADASYNSPTTPEPRRWYGILKPPNGNPFNAKGCFALLNDGTWYVAWNPVDAQLPLPNSGEIQEGDYYLCGC